jgi:hypothetical protein
MMINIEEKEIDRALVKYLISPFHSESVEGMDLSINKPYLITCSKDFLSFMYGITKIKFML